MTKRRTVIIATIDDLVSKFLYYDRKEDQQLPCGAIENAITDGEITVDGIVDQFRYQFVKGLDFG